MHRFPVTISLARLQIGTGETILTVIVTPSAATPVTVLNTIIKTFTGYTATCTKVGEPLVEVGRPAIITGLVNKPQPTFTNTRRHKHAAFAIQHLSACERR